MTGFGGSQTLTPAPHWRMFASMRRSLVLASLFFAATASAAIPTSERDALIAVYESTNGPGWTDRTNWLGAGGTECTWFGVTCDESQSNVIYLELEDNHLDGTLPSSLRHLTKLKSLFVFSNDLRGALPPELGELPDLEWIFATRNGFTGNIPASFAALKKLRLLQLDENQLSGGVPAHLAGMTALEELGLSNNQFSGSIPSEVAQLTNLKVLDLSTNQLTGGIPSALGSFAKLERLYLGDNQLTGSIPSQLGDLATLVDLRLGFNQLSGPLPPSLGDLHALELLAVSFNQLSGAIPDTLGGLDAIKQIDLNTNQFSGPIPASLYGLNTLEELKLGENELTGTISPQIGNLASLQVLYLYDNQFSGPIPIELANIVPLRTIELQNNELTGTIPPDFSRLANLTWLDVASNQLTGTIPPQLGATPNLEVLSVYENDLEGSIPRELGQLANLRLLLLGGNRFTGGIPDELRNLKKLEQFNVNGNQLTGAVPFWIGEWTSLTDLFLSENQFSGPLPPGLATLENLTYLDLGENRLSGRFIDFTRLTKLIYLTVQDNQFSGPLPPSIGLLSNLSYATFGSNDFSGPLPPEIGGLVNVELLDLSGNEFDGPIPKEIANLKKAYNISLYANHFSGTIPKEIGQLTSLQFLGLSFNALIGPIPPEITAMTGLEDHRSDFAYNGLFANDQATRAFVNLKHYDGDFEATQTVMPANVQIVETTDRSATLSWIPIRYEYYGGGYQVAASTTPNGPVVALATSSSKSLDRFTLRNLQPATTYYFTVATVSHPISGQPNLITSTRTVPIQGTTKQRVIAPPDVVMTDTPNGLVQIDGAEVQADSFTLTNFGDVATSITLDRNETFFTIAPAQFSLAAGASQVVTVHAVTQPTGTYYGYVTIDGQGVPEDLYAEIVLLASARPSGSVVATPLATRIELAGEAGSDEVGTAQFRNTGTARLTGIVISDQPWVEVDPEPITIDPGQIGEVNFRIVRSKRPASEGALSADLSLIYVSGTSDARTIATLATTIPISVSKVTIVDITQPGVVTGPIPALQPGEIPFYIPGLIASTSTRSDLSLINGGGPSLINDLKLYFTGGAQTSIASLQPLGFAQSVNLVNIVGSVYGTTGSGGLQLRSSSAEGISATAKVTAVTDEGTYSGAIPVFRGDRSAPPGQKIYLAGVTTGGDLIVQETGGSPGTIGIVFVNAAGATVSTRTENIGAHGLLELRNAVPANTATAIVSSAGSSVITAYARLHAASGDSWSVVDWSRYYGYERTATTRIPFADGRGGTPRRRAAKHDAPGRLIGEAEARRKTDLALFNPTNATVSATLQVIDTAGRVSERTTNVAAQATVIVSDVASLAGSSVAHVVIVPGRSELVVTARSYGVGSGSAIPVVSATTGLRLGQTQVFSGLDDAASLRTGYGFAETGGGTAKVRARIIIGGDTSTLVSIVTERTFTLNAREQVFLPELVRSFAGDSRDSLFGDLHGLVLEIEVIEGAGAIVPFVLATDVGTEDINVVVQ
jgi:Leucine-rich repeat (LRR) protein